jgi:hypothetical protein
MNPSPKYCFVLGLLWAVCFLGCGYDPSYLQPGEREPELKSALEKMEKLHHEVLFSSKPTSEQYLNLALLRLQISRIYKHKLIHVPAQSNRSKHYTLSCRVSDLTTKAIWELRKARRKNPKPEVDLRALMELAAIYRDQGFHRSREWELCLREILEKYPDVKDAALFPVGHTSRYYAYHGLANVYRARNEPGETLAAMAFATLAIEPQRSDSPQMEKLFSQQVNELVQADPRLVLPKYQNLVIKRMRNLIPGPFDLEETKKRLTHMFDEYKKSAPNRITLTLEHVGPNGILVAYDAFFPEVPEKRKKYKQMAQSRQWSAMPPSLGEYVLESYLLPAEESFRRKRSLPASQIPMNINSVFDSFTFTQPLEFDKTGRAKGRIILAWSKDARSKANWLSFYLLMRPTQLVTRAMTFLSTKPTYIQPLLIGPGKLR